MTSRRCAKLQSGEVPAGRSDAGSRWVTSRWSRTALCLDPAHAALSPGPFRHFPRAAWSSHASSPGRALRAAVPGCGRAWRRHVCTRYTNPGNRLSNGPRSLERRHESPGFRSGWCVWSRARPGVRTASAAPIRSQPLCSTPSPARGPRSRSRKGSAGDRSGSSSVPTTSNWRAAACAQARANEGGAADGNASDEEPRCWSPSTKPRAGYRSGARTSTSTCCAAACARSASDAPAASPLATWKPSSNACCRIPRTLRPHSARPLRFGL